MNSRILAIAAVLLGLAALSPAPINDPMAAAAKNHGLHDKSQAEMAHDQMYDGNQHVVGNVPTKTDDNGFSQAAPANDEQAAKELASHEVVVSDPKAIAALRHANAAIKKQEEGSGFSWITALLVFALGFGVFQGLRFWMEKNGPAPKRLK